MWKGVYIPPCKYLELPDTTPREYGGTLVRHATHIEMLEEPIGTIPGWGRVWSCKNQTSKWLVDINKNFRHPNHHSTQPCEACTYTDQQ